MAQVTKAHRMEEFKLVPDEVDKNNRPMSESDLIDSLFSTCDVERTGQVYISRLIEYLKFTTSNISENDEDLNHLAYMLDPNGFDSVITINKYRGIMKTWIDNIRNRKYRVSSATSCSSFISESCDSECDEVFHSNTLGHATTLMTTAGGDHPTMGDDHVNSVLDRRFRVCDSDNVELNHRISDLQHQNKRLLEENVKLQQQLEIQEETLAISSAEAENLQKKIKSLQGVVELRQDTQQENEELKATVSKLQEKRKEQENKLNLLERENSALDNKNAEWEKKVQILSGQLEYLKAQNQEQNVSLAEHKHRLMQIQEVKTMQEVHLNERFNEVKTLQNQNHSLSKNIEELRQEKSDLQLQYTQTLQELTSLQSKIERLGVREPDEEDIVHKEMMLQSPVNTARLVCSTPLKSSNSICFELKNMLVTDKFLPSPLCAKEYFDEMLNDVTSHVTTTDKDDYSSLEEEDISFSTKDDLTMEISRFADKYKQKQQDLLEDIDSHLKSVFTSNDKGISTDFQKNLKIETDKMTQKVVSLAKAKERADSRITKLKGKLMELKEDNRLLQTANQNTRNALLNTGLELETSIDNRLMVLKDTVDKERSYIRMLEKELAVKNRALMLIGNIQDGNEPSFNLDTLLKEIDRLKRANLDVTEKYQKSEVQIQDIEDELYRSKEELENHKLQCDELEDNLASCKLARQLDLKDIWRLVHKDVEKECIEEQKETSLLVAPENLKEQISQEIKTLKTQLYKRQAALGLLTSKSTVNHPPIYQSCSCFGNYNGSNASSPLVEALTIDFFNGNHPSYKCKKETYSSEMDLISNFGCEKCQSLSTNSWKVGNSSLSNRSQTQRQQSQGENNNNSQTNLNKSISSSSTSGAADLDLSTSTLKSTDGRTRRKEFQNLRWESDDVICRSTESQSSSATDGGIVYHISNEGGLNRTVDHNDNTYDPSLANNLRRWSFNAAIANQNYASDDMVHYPRCRSQSFQAAIESGQRTPSTDNDLNPEVVFGSAFISSTDKGAGSETNEKHSGFTKLCVYGSNCGKCPKCVVSKAQSAGSVKSRDKFMKSFVDCYGMFSEPVDDYCWNDNMDPKAAYSSLSFSHLSYPTTSAPTDAANDNRSSPKLTRKLSILVEEDDVLSDTDGVPTPKMTSGQSASAYYNSSGEYSPHSKKRNSYSSDFARDNKRHCVTTKSTSSYSSDSNSYIVNSGVISFHQPYRSSYQDNSGTESCSSFELSPEKRILSTECQDEEVKSEVKVKEVDKTEDIIVPPEPCNDSLEVIHEEERQNVSATTELTLQLEKLTIEENSLDMNKTATQEKSRSLSPNLLNKNNHTPNHDIIEECETEKDQASSPNGQLRMPADDISPELKQVGSKLAKIRLEHLNRKRDHMKCSKMPELKEQTTESQSCPLPSTVITVREPSPPEAQTETHQNGDTQGGILKPPPASDQPVLPSLPDVFLKKLGLLGDPQKGSTVVDQKSLCHGTLPSSINSLVIATPSERADQLSELDIENKFTSLSLAFKTDKLTLEKRLEIQERSRDIAEQNVDKELKGLKENLDTLNQLCTDSQVRDVLRKIQNHVDVLEMSTARVSSRAEVFGAVQQEKRMSKAIEIMLTHVDNIRMVHDRVNTELEDARRMIQDSRPFGGSGDFSSLSRRSASVCQGVQNARISGRRMSETTTRPSDYTKVGRRRGSEIQLPRVLGGTGVPSFTQSASMDVTSSECKSPMLRKDASDEDAKSRFKQVVANAAIKNAVTDSLMRRTSVDAKPVTPPTALSRENSTDSKNRDGSDNTLSKQNSKEEEAFQQGFRQGYKAQIGQELKSLREQQTSINTSLEELMDNCEEPPEEDVKTLKDTVVTKLWDMVPEWEVAGKRLRMTMAGLVLFMALCSIVMSFLPIGQANAKVFPEYKHMGRPPL